MTNDTTPLLLLLRVPLLLLQPLLQRPRGPEVLLCLSAASYPEMTAEASQISKERRRRKAVGGRQ